MERLGRSRRGGRIVYPVLAGLLIAGGSFVGIAVASQQAPSPLVSTDGSAEAARAAELLLRSLAPETSATVTSPAPIAVLPASRPIALDIASIDVHSKLLSLGLDGTGAVETPTGTLYDEPGWYRYSPTPGSMGPSVILGHVDSAANGPSVFYRLGELKPGNKIVITRADGSVAVFTVDAVRRFSKSEFPTKLVYGNLGHAGLRLITCGGVFDDSTGHYEDNIVVFASLN